MVKHKVSEENITSLIVQREKLVDKIIDLASYPEYHDNLRDSIDRIDDLIKALTIEEQQLVWLLKSQVKELEGKL